MMIIKMLIYSAAFHDNGFCWLLDSFSLVMYK